MTDVAKGETFGNCRKGQSFGWKGQMSETLQLTGGPMTDEQKTRLVALQDAWLAVLEKYRWAESVPERDAVITEFVKRHIAETDTAILEAFQHWQVRSASEAT
jgi:hypothetical protein